MSFDLDDVIERAAASSRSRFPAGGNPIDRVVQRELAHQTRDRNNLDAIARRRVGPMRYLDDSAPSPVVVPTGQTKPRRKA